MILPRDSKEFIASLNSANVKYLIVGGYALALHGLPRTTSDLDVFVEISAENADRLCAAIREFGFDSVGLQPKDFLSSDQVVQLGVRPGRIDVLTSISGVEFEHAWSNRVSVVWEGLPVSVIGKADLIANKRATGRPRDLTDVAELERS